MMVLIPLIGPALSLIGAVLGTNLMLGPPGWQIPGALVLALSF